jgi:hypothetical protein
MAMSRIRPASWSLVRTAQTCLIRSGGFGQINFPVFQAKRFRVPASSVSCLCMSFYSVAGSDQHGPSY